MSIADARQFRYSAVVGTVWNVVMAWGAQQHLHPMLFGIVVASIFAAIMSTADSRLLVAASSVVRDVYQKVIHRDHDVPQANLVRYSQGVVIAPVVVSVIVGHLAEELVFWLVLFPWAGLGAALGPAAILAPFWRRRPRQVSPPAVKLL